MYKYLIFITISSLVLTTACDREDIKQERHILGKWEIQEYTIDSVDVRDFPGARYTDITFEFHDDGDIEQAWQEDSLGFSFVEFFEGEWDIENDKLDLHFYNLSASNFFADTTGTSEVYNINTLDEDKLSLKTNINNKTIIIKGIRPL